MPEVEFISRLAIEQQALILLLMVPIVATIVGIARYIIGVKSLGIYAPVVLTFALYALGFNGNLDDGSNITIGIGLGLFFMALVIFTSIISARLLKGSRLHYFPKISIIVSMVAIALLVGVIAGEIAYGQGFSSINALALILIATVAEQFASVLFKKKIKNAVWLLFETLATSIVCYVLIAWQDFQDFIVSYPYFIFITFIINYFIGRYRGLRIREYIRFKDVFTSINQD
jgi:hypothetical protein